MVKNEETYYFAYYKNITEPIAISTNLELVKEYMEVHRMVRQKSYNVTQFSLSLPDVMSSYSNSLIENYENWYLPAVDIEMIKMNSISLEESINKTIEGLKDILVLVKDIKKIPESDKNIILKSMQIINDFRYKKKIWNKLVDSYKLSDLIFMDMDTYWGKRRMFIDFKESRQRWGFLIEQKGDGANGIIEN